MTMCEATNEAGAPCLYLEHAPQVRHLWGDSNDRNSFDLGKLQEAVRQFLAGDGDREFLARPVTAAEKAS